MHTECFAQEGRAAVAVQFHVFSNSAADKGKMSTACVRFLKSEARATLMQHKGYVDPRARNRTICSLAIRTMTQES